MPVSKKRKKDGRPVQRKVDAPATEAHPHGPEVPPAEAPPRPAVGRPANPFLAQQQGRRGAQRGR
jgi:hypothetical protein